jgi:glycosyltransferase involved in cell wall biosynthesis
VRIAIFSKTFWPSLGGVEATTHILARSLLDLGHTPIVFTSTVLGTETAVPGEYLVVRNATLLNLIRHFSQVDLVIVNGGISVPACLAACFWKKRLIVWHQMVGPMRHFGYGIHGWIRDFIGLKLQSHVDLHVGVSKECLASKKLPLNSSAVVIYNPIAPEFEGLANQSKPISKNIDVLFVGRLIEGKGILVLAEALTRLDKDGQTITVCFAGTGPDSDQVRATLKSYNNIRCHFAGRLGYSELADVYSRSRCLVLPSTTHPEGMPVVIAEALSFGLPIIGSDQKAIIEAVGQAGLICPQGDVTKLAEALRLLLSDHDACAGFSNAAAERSRLFSYQIFSKKVESILKPPKLSTVAPNQQVIFYFGVFAPVGGIEQFSVNLLNGLSDLNINTTLVCSGRAGWMPPARRFRLVRVPYLPGSRYHVSDYLLLLLRGLREARKASTIIFGKHPPQSILNVLRKWCGKKTKFIFVTPYAPIEPQTPDEHRQLTDSLKNYDLIIVQAETFRQTLQAAGIKIPIEILSYPLHPEVYQMEVKKFPPVPPWRIGFLGRLEPQKDLDLLIEAFEKIERRGCELHIYGSGSEQTRLQAKSRQSPLNGKIFFHGRISSSDVSQVVSENHLFAYSSRAEGQVLAALEILASGRPIAAVPAGALSEILSDETFGLCTSSRDSDSLAEAITNIMDKIQGQNITPNRIRERFEERWRQGVLISKYASLFEP